LPFDHPDLPYWLVTTKVGLPGPEIRKINMNLCNPHSILSKVAILILSSAIAANAADSFSDADKAFVAKVSQGGMYEVELGKLAQTKAMAQDIKIRAILKLTIICWSATS
jgi:hypothetical protein